MRRIRRRLPMWRWNDASVAAKLPVAILGVLLLAFALIPLTIQSSINEAAYNGIRTAQRERVDSLSESFTRFMNTTNNNIGTLIVHTSTPIVNYFRTLKTTNNDAARRTALATISQAFLDQLNNDLNFVNIRLIDASGRQVMRAYRQASGGSASVITNTGTITEVNQPYFPAVVQLGENATRLAAIVHVTVNPEADERTAQVEFDYSSSIRLANDQSAGAVIVGVSADQGLSEFLGTFSASTSNSVTLLDSEQRTIASTDQKGRRYLFDGQTIKISDPIDLKRLTTASYNGEILQDRVISSRAIPISMLNGTGDWQVIVGQATIPPIQSASILFQNALLPFLAIGIAMFVATFLVQRSVTRPIREITRAARRIAGGELDVEAPVHGQDEIGQMGQSLNAMVKQMAVLLETLETRVTSRTRDIAVASEISREAATLRDIDDLLQRAVNAIRDQFKFYHVQIFLVDDRQKFAVLRTSTGEAGRQMLARHHRLEIGSQSVIGQVTAQNRPVVTLDTLAEGAAHRFNPLLPNTRSEMALPMRTGNVLIGALDVQSTIPNAFDESNIQVFQVLADQLAIAVSNSRLIEESQQSAQQVAELNRRLTRQSWNEFIEDRRGQPMGFRYDQTDLEPVAPSDGSNGHHANGDAPDPGGLSAAINVRGEAIGFLSAQADVGATLTADDRSLVESIAQRVALAIDNVRLVERTQLTLSEIGRLYEASRALGGAPDLEAAYTVVADQLATINTIDLLAIARSSPAPVPNPAQFITGFTWARATVAARIADVALHFGESAPGLARVAADPYIAQNIKSRADLPSSLLTDNTPLSERIQSVLITPIFTGDRWYGVMVFGSLTPDGFTKNTEQFASAIGDQLAVVIENRRLFEESQIEARRNRALAETAQLSSQIGTDFVEGISKLLSVLATPADYDRWWFGSLSADGDYLERIVAQGITSAELPAPIAIHETIGALGEAARLNTPVVVNDRDHYSMREIPAAQARALGKHLVLPITNADRLTGALLIGRGFDRPDFDERDLQLIATLGNQLAIALDNRRLFDAAETGRGTLQSVLNSLPAGVVVVDAITHQVTLSNEQANILLGLDKSVHFELAGIRENQDHLSDDFPAIQVLTSDEPLSLSDVLVRHADGTEVSLLINAAPIRNADGQVISAVSVFTDTSELRELQTALQSNLHETTSLYQASRQISAQSNLQDMIVVTMGQIHQFLAADLILMIFKDEQGALGEVYEVLIEDTVSAVRSTGALPFDRALLSEMGENVINPPDPSDTQPKRPDMARTTLPALGTFPLRVRGRTIGWLVIGYRTKRSITPDERRFMIPLSDQFAISAEAIRLSLQTAQALRETERLYLAGREINSTSSVAEVAGVLRDQLQSMRPDRIDIFVVVGRGGLNRIDWITRWEAAPPNARNTLLMEHSYISDVDLMTHEPLFIENIDIAAPADIEMVERLPLSENVRAQIGVPMRVKGNYVGRVIVSFFEPRPFQIFERQFIAALTEQASVLIDNIMLYRESEDSFTETSMLYQVSRDIADSTDNGGVLGAIVNNAIPKAVTRVMLIELLTPNWDDPDSAIEIAADWSRTSSFIVPGMHFTASQFPGWKELSSPDIRWVDDAGSAPQLSDESRLGFLAFDIQAFVVVPLIASGKAIGAVLIGCESLHEHSDREIRVYTALADQAAVAIENRNLLRQTERRARQLATSAAVGQAATSILELDVLLDRTVNLIQQSFSYDHVQIFLIGADGREALLQASTGDAGEKLLSIHHHLAVNSASVIGRVTGSGKLYNVVDTADSRSTHRPNPYLIATRSELALPLLARGTVIGALDVQSNMPGAFTGEDERVLGTLADQIAVAIDNARLFTLSTKRAEEGRFLFDVTQTAAATAELDVALSRVTRMVHENTAADLVVLMLTNDERKRLLLTYTMREDAGYILPSSLPMNLELVSQVRRTNQPVHIHEGADRRLFNPDDVAGLQSMLAVPLNTGEEFVGVLVIASEKRDAYNTDSVQLLQTLSSTLTAIIQNARLLREVQEANQQLVEVDRLKSQFLANMSHELRTPLNSIIGFSRVILKGIDGPLNETQQQDLTTIFESGNHLLALVNDILDQAKIEAGKMELSVEFFPIDELIKSVMATAIGLVKDKPIRLHQEIQGDMPPVYADKFRTRQVLLNMLSNAAKFTRQGSVTVASFVITDGDRQMVQISVTDTGIGIAKENIRRVFAQFEQVDNTTARGAEGTGLGMPIAKSLIEMQGGRIWLESEPGVGSTFSITLPLQPPEPMTPSETVTPGASGNAALEQQVEMAMTEAELPAERPHRIVVAVDDEAGMITMYRRYLAKSGFEVIGTTKPDEAGDLIVNYKPRVVLLDVNMPGRNGWEVLQILKDNDTTFSYPVIVCSIEEDKVRAYRLGAADYLVKPFVEEDLIGAIRRIEMERDLPIVLLVDDRPEFLQMLRGALSVQEDVLRILEAASMELGGDMISSQHPNLVIFGVNGDTSDVFTALDAMRAAPDGTTQRVMVVAAGELSLDDRARLRGANIPLIQSPSAAELLAAVKTALGLD